MKNNKNSKVRIRTKLELVERKKNFLKITDILKKKKNYFFFTRWSFAWGETRKKFYKMGLGH